MPGNHDRVPIPPKEDMNRNLSSAREQTMLEVFGRPGRLTRDCSEPTGDFVRRVVTQNVGPFRVTGFAFAVETLERIFAEVRTEHRDVFDEVRLQGCCACGIGAVTPRAFPTIVGVARSTCSSALPWSTRAIQWRIGAT